MPVNDPNNLFRIEGADSSMIEVDQIQISNNNDPKACNPTNDTVSLTGKIVTSQNQSTLSQYQSSGDHFNMEIYESQSTLDEDWRVENAKITDAISQTEWEWSAQGLTD